MKYIILIIGILSCLHQFGYAQDEKGVTPPTAEKAASVASSQDKNDITTKDTLFPYEVTKSLIDEKVTQIKGGSFSYERSYIVTELSKKTENRLSVTKDTIYVSKYSLKENEVFKYSREMGGAITQTKRYQKISFERRIQNDTTYIQLDATHKLPIKVERNDELINKFISKNNDTIFLKKDGSFSLKNNDTFILKNNNTLISKNYGIFFLKNNDTLVLKNNDTLILKTNVTIPIFKNVKNEDSLSFTTTKTLPKLNNIHVLHRIRERVRFKERKRPVMRVSLGTMQGWAYRTMSINNPQFEQRDEQLKRQQSDRSIYGYSLNASVGINVSRSSSLNLEGVMIQQGFTSTNGAIDFKTGFLTDGERQKYRFRNAGFGIVYSYDHYGSTVGPAADVGLFTTWIMDTPNQNTLQTSDLRLNNFAMKVAAGINISPRFWYVIRVLPTFYYDFKSIDRATELKSNPYNLGLTLSLCYRFRFRKE